LGCWCVDQAVPVKKDRKSIDIKQLIMASRQLDYFVRQPTDSECQGAKSGVRVVSVMVSFRIAS
jgi:hypothetical protein